MDVILRYATRNENKRVLDVNWHAENWQSGSISNGEYILWLNFMSNRSFNDLT